MGLTDVQVRDLMGLGFTPFQVNYLRPLIGATGGGGLAGIVSVRDFGAVGDGITDDTVPIQAAIYAAFGNVDNPNGSNTSLNKQLYFPPGNYKTFSVLTIPPVQGAVIYGAGRFTTTIINNTGSGIFKTNGFNYSTLSDMQLQSSSATGVLFDHNHDGLTHFGVGSAFFCEFRNLYFSGGSICMQAGAGGFTCSDNVYSNCTFQNASIAGLKTCNFNSLDHVLINCAFSGCPIGIWVSQGSVASVISSGFANNTSWDIQIDNDGGGGTVLAGIRTESPNFVFANAPIVLNGCGQSCLTNGTFVQGRSLTTINSCVSSRGIINIVGPVTVNCFQIGRDDWFISDQFNCSAHFSGIKTPSNQLFNINTTYAMLPSPAGLTGVRGFIKDATVNTLGSVVNVGGGAFKVGVMSIGTNWVVG